ncbi:hypothetical protein [Mesorhizobium sp.]|uniref:hypothetical protein n=1 Tax=Mesorhizobium sp. TaxID=1871066 RepID=UPI000FE8C381|nr:hypothetical protein [Mesorhizobium sp.]RWB53051.1 MAG: hypothetical protein EOQ47_23470 [Mesorhizobium sp.]
MQAGMEFVKMAGIPGHCFEELFAGKCWRVGVCRLQCGWSGSAVLGIADLLRLFVFMQFRTENRYALFLELL